MTQIEHYNELALHREGESRRERDIRLALKSMLVFYESVQLVYERAMERINNRWTDDYQKLKSENEALRDEIHQLRQQLPYREESKFGGTRG